MYRQCRSWHPVAVAAMLNPAEVPLKLNHVFTCLCRLLMQGHTAAVTHVVVNERSNQIISLSADKVIKVRHGIHGTRPKSSFAK